MFLDLDLLKSHMNQSGLALGEVQQGVLSRPVPCCPVTSHAVPPLWGSGLRQTILHVEQDVMGPGRSDGAAEAPATGVGGSHVCHSRASHSQ